MKSQRGLAPIKFVDLASQREKIREALYLAVDNVISGNNYILGSHAASAEAKLRDYTGATDVVACGSGTDALILSLVASGIRPGDAVICPSLTFVATVEAIVRCGAIPIFVDVDSKSLTLDPARVIEATIKARSRGLNVQGIITVDLFGMPSFYAELRRICELEDLFLVADSAQSFGAEYCGRRMGAIVPYSATSFYPSKPLSIYGDGGAVFTQDEHSARALRRLREHGLSESLDDVPEIGMLSRMDALQAAILVCKLEIFDEELLKRRAVARIYNDCFPSEVKGQYTMSCDFNPSYSAYVIQCPRNTNKDCAQILNKMGIPCRTYYTTPVHLMTAYCVFDLGFDLNVTIEKANSLLAIPIHPYLSDEEIRYIIEGVAAVIGL